MKPSVDLVVNDLNPDSRRDVGRPGFDDWQVIVFAVVRHACNLNYDKQQNLAKEHRSLRQFKKTVRKISQIAASKSPTAKARLPAAYENLLNRANVLL